MPSSSRVWRRLFAALGVWLALTATPVTAAPPAPRIEAAGPIVLGPQPGSIDLAGRSQQLLDPAGSLGIEEIETDRHTGAWQPREAGQRLNLARGAALWIRFEAVQGHHDAAWALELTRSGTDFIELYHRDAQGRWRVQRAGDRLPVRDWASPDRYPVFRLEARPGEAVRYWVRIEHARVPFSGELRLRDVDTLRTLRIHQQFGLGVYFGMALLLTLVALVHVGVYRDRAFALYALYTVLLGLGMAASLGVGGQFLWPGQARWNQVAEFVLMPLMGVAGLLFVRQVTQPRRLGPALNRLGLGLALLWLAVVAWDLIAPSRISLQAVTALGAGVMATVAAMLWRAWRSGEGWLRWFVLGMLPVLLAGALPVMRNFNLISSGFLSQYGMVIAAVLEAPVLVFALLQRSRVQHESQMRARSLERAEPLTGLMVRSHLLLCLQDSLVRAQRYGHPCALLLVRLDNHADLLERHGREVADRALVITAAMLRSQARDVDTAARVGDRDFALLMDGPVKDTQAADVATSLVAAGLRASDRLPPGTTLPLRVVVAMLPDARNGLGQDAEAHLGWLHEGLRLLGEDPRKAILRLNF